MKSIRVWRYSVSLLTIASLVINIILVLILLDIGQGMQSAFATARDSLAAARDEPVELMVSIDQQVPISTTVPFSETFLIPMRLDFPLSTQVTTFVNIPLLGRQEIVVPVEATIPISETLEIPLNMTIPVNVTPTLRMDIPVRMALPSEIVDALDGFIDEFEEGLRLRVR